MSRAIVPVCHGRRMKLDTRTRQYVCRRCGGWMVRWTYAAS
ncbi:hypothetical protein ACPXCP_39865 [Streptomyces sp. DT20]